MVDVASNGPAAKAGLQGSNQQATINGQQIPVGGDVITAIDGKSVNSFKTGLDPVRPNPGRTDDHIDHPAERPDEECVPHPGSASEADWRLGLSWNSAGWDRRRLCRRPQPARRFTHQGSKDRT